MKGKALLTRRGLISGIAGVAISTWPAVAARTAAESNDERKKLAYFSVSLRRLGPVYTVERIQCSPGVMQPEETNKVEFVCALLDREKALHEFLLRLKSLKSATSSGSPVKLKHELFSPFWLINMDGKAILTVRSHSAQASLIRQYDYLLFEHFNIAWKPNDEDPGCLAWWSS